MSNQQRNSQTATNKNNKESKTPTSRKQPGDNGTPRKTQP
ncbi:hypothetical protein NIES2100_55120 [Calothrix sp. NIES-2100]|nr:hypothetical protein NIES2100_55120 [Calothrix sp. NIES-2100]